MVGFGAAFSLIVAHVETVSNFIALSQLRGALILYLVGLVLAVPAKLLGTMVEAGLAGKENGEALLKKIMESGPLPDPAKFAADFNAEFLRGFLPPQRWLAQGTLNKAAKGDEVAGARFVSKVCQVQATLIILQAVFAIFAAFTLAFGVKL
jgi:hypothetical protein